MDCLNTGYKVQSNIAGMSLVADSSNKNISDSQRNKHRELDHSKEEMASDQKTFVPKILHHDGNTSGDVCVVAGWGVWKGNGCSTVGAVGLSPTAMIWWR